LYIVTEFCKDGDLKELLLKKKLTEVEVIFVSLYLIGLRDYNSNSEWVQGIG
jgi:hypothetical protein